MEPPRHTLLLVRHGEMGLKSHSVRARLERMLSDRIEAALIHRGVEAIVSKTQARHYVETDDLEGASDALRHTFGITSFSPAARVKADMDSITTAAAGYASAHFPDDAVTFAIRARRVGDHPFSSQDVGMQAGSAVYLARQAEGRKVKVDLGKPDFAIHVEVRHKDAYLWHEKLSGPGGLPLGSQGRMVVLLDSGDAAAAAYLMMRRGARVYPLALQQIAGTMPYQGPAEEHPAQRWHAALADWDPTVDLKAWMVADDQQVAQATGDPVPDAGVPLAKVSVEAALRYARQRDAQAVVTGETVRTPWARRLPETEPPTSEIPVLRPLMGLTRPLIDDFREIVGLPRLAGPRADESQRAYTAGGRRDVRRQPDVAPENEGPAAAGFDPW